jgi:predicted HTH transcriptional regulator
MKYHINDESFEENLDLLTKNKKYNLLAELMSDENRISIKIARFQGKDKSVLLEKSEYGYQCLLVAVDRILNRLEAENYTMSTMTGSRRIDKRLLDMHSLKEVLINAMVHNDWTRVEPAVYLFEDRIEVISYGGLPYGQTEEMFFKGVSTPRNKALMRIFNDLEYSEQTGHGIPDVIAFYGKEVFNIDENYINVVLPFDEDVLNSNKNKSNKNVGVNVGVKLNKTQQYVYTLIKNKPNITYIELALEIKKSAETIRRNIKSLVDLNIIKRVGSDKKGYWEIIKIIDMN